MASSISMDDFNTLKVIGKGTYGKVLLVRKNDTGEFFAIKQLKKNHIEESGQVEHILAER